MVEAFFIKVPTKASTSIAPLMPGFLARGSRWYIIGQARTFSEGAKSCGERANLKP